METIEQMKRSIAELDRQIKEKRELRISLGLPAERPADFVEASHARAIVPRVKVLQEVLTSILQMTNENKQVVPFPLDSFEQYRDLLTVLMWTDDNCLGYYGGCLDKAINVLKGSNNSYEKVVTELYSTLNYAQRFLELADDGIIYDGTDEQLDAIIADYMQHYEEVVAPQVAHEAAVMAKYEGGKAE